MGKFTYFTTESYKLPKYGFKIHVSATIESYEEVFGLATNFLSKQELFYKYLSTREDFIENISKTAAPAESGKLFTIYPENIKATERILVDLSEILVKFEGVYILSDRNFNNSKTVFYRFGFFQNIDECTIVKNGKIWEDFQKTYFDLPAWISDPFYQENKEMNEKNRLNDLDLTKIIRQNNGGNIYFGTVKNQKIIVKESRANILTFVNLKSEELRENEFFMSELLNSADFLQPIEKFSAWINHYYVYKFIDGQTLREFQSKFSLFDNLTENKLVIFSKIIKQLIEILGEAHHKMVILDDIHPDNFLIDKAYKIHFIDLESAHKFNELEKVTAKTKGFYLKIWSKLTETEKDLRKVGQLILFLIGQLNVFNQQERSLEETIILAAKIFERFEVETNISDLLIYLFTGSSTKKALEISKKLYFYKSDIFLHISKEYLEEPKNLVTFIKENKFEHLGLNGLTGYLWKLSILEKNELINEKIEYLLSQLSDSFLHLSGKHYSPYILNGSSGLALFLLIYNFEKYEKQIIKIANGMNVKFAKSMDFEKGLSGISYFLLILYQKTGNKKYLYWADEQLKTCELFVKNKKLYNFYTKRYEESFLKGYEGYKFTKELRRKL